MADNRGKTINGFPSNHGWAVLASACLATGIFATSGCTLKPHLAAVTAALNNSPAPTISEISSNVGFSGGGNTLTITGSGFKPGIRVLIGESDCKLKGGYTSAKLICETGPGNSGTHDVVVMNMDSKIGKLNGAFSYKPDAFTQADWLAGSTSWGFADGLGKAARFNSNQQIATNGTSVFVNDYGNWVVRRIEPETGLVSTFAGNPFSSTESDSTTEEPHGVFDGNYGMAMDDSNLYVSDSAGSTIRKIEISSGKVSTIAGVYQETGAEDSNQKPLGRFNSPAGLSHHDGALYIADTGNHTIRKLVLASGEVTTLAGDSGTSGSTDGVGTAASFTSPDDVLYIPEFGDLYVSDSGNNTIRKIHIATGDVMTVAGDPAAPGELKDGTGPTAHFYSPSAMAYDGSSIYVVDVYNNAIRKIVIATQEVSTLAGRPDTNVDHSGTLAGTTFHNVRGVVYDPKYGLFVATEYGILRIH